MDSRSADARTAAVPGRRARSNAGAVPRARRDARNRHVLGRVFAGDRDYVYLVQTWLWRSNDRWLAYYTRRIAQCGSTNDFVAASPFVGKAIGDQVFFDPAGSGKPIETFHIAAPPAAANRIDGEVVYSGQPLEKLALERGAVLQSPIYDSAPLVDFDATSAWLSTVSVGYFMTWHAGCPTTASVALR